MSRGVSVLLLLLLTLAGCGAPRGRGVTLPGIIAPDSDDPAIRQLQRDLTGIFTSPPDAPILWAVAVRSLESGDPLYRLNDTLLVMPASNVKIATLAAAADRLGWDFQYETTLVADGVIENGTLKGDLVVRGSGDPAIQPRTPTTPTTFEAWARALRERGVARIEGRIVGDDNAMEDERPGSGWAWDDLHLGFAAPPAALQINENVADLTIAPGPLAGEQALIVVTPPHSGLMVTNRVVTSAPGSSHSVGFRRTPGEATVVVSGSVPLDGGPFLRTVTVPNPTEFFVRNLRDALATTGIEVTGAAVDIDTLDDESEHETTRETTPLVTHRSPSLRDLALLMMQYSQNLYAEALLNAMGHDGTTAGGLQTVRQVLATWGLERDDAMIVDGSGLSRYNYMTPAALVEILSRMHGDGTHAAPFWAVLPRAGLDGTLTGRLRGTVAERRVRAKTGSLSNVRALSGYADTADGERLAFSIIANNFSMAGAEVDLLIDRAVERLAVFRRR